MDSHPLLSAPSGFWHRVELEDVLSSFLIDSFSVPKPYLCPGLEGRAENLKNAKNSCGILARGKLLCKSPFAVLLHCADIGIHH